MTFEPNLPSIVSCVIVVVILVLFITFWRKPRKRERERKTLKREQEKRMHSRFNLVVILLTLGCVISGIHTSSLDASTRGHKTSSSSSSSLTASNTPNALSTKPKRPVSVKIHRPAITHVISTRKTTSMANGTIGGNPNMVKDVAIIGLKTNKHELIHDLHSDYRIALKRDAKKKRKHKRKRNRALMALLLAYKLKFTALIPTIIGGLFLLLSTTALAGFFFALFAAVLGLKKHP